MNRIKIYFYTLAFLLSTVMLSSCGDWLDVRPESETVLEDYWQTESQANSVLMAAYRGMIRDGFMERVMVWGELRSDNIVEGNGINGDMQRILDVNLTPTNNLANWGDFYSVVNYCNTFLYYAPEVLNRDANFSVTKLRTMEAEAYAVRALTYFYLVRAFRDVPLVTEPSISDDQNFDVAKSPENEVIQFIIDDLLKAKQNIKRNYGREAFNKGRITLSGLNSILADVYLWAEQYTNCIAVCNEVLADETLQLERADNFLHEVFYKGNSTESIFELQFDRNTQYNNKVRDFYGISQDGVWAYALYLGPQGNEELRPFNYKPSSINESEKDYRNSYFINTKSNIGNGYRILKYVLVDAVEDQQENITPVFRSTATTPNWIVYRLSDVILMKAEALAQRNDSAQHDLQNALNLVNITYLRSNETADSLKISNYPLLSDVQELVLRERQREFMFEGKRWFDLMRIVKRKNDATSILKFIGSKLTGDNMQMKKMSIIDALYMPIHERQIEINPNLVQNPFYVENEDGSVSY
ncbi:MAG: RagB/SusD family nutrient uptake outer membrane protein [Paludibacteraceae bacterium]|nr:RagB/SusD family nutrient uptake outer membrane protein [Paludibacteraceae bacterium]